LKDSISTPLAWYLILTKLSREQYVHEQLSRVLPEIFLPMFLSRRRHDFVAEA
jgi:hypothetical protein